MVKPINETPSIKLVCFHICVLTNCECPALEEGKVAVVTVLCLCGGSDGKFSVSSLFIIVDGLDCKFPASKDSRA